MDKDEFQRDMRELYQRMRSMTSEFGIRKAKMDSCKRGLDEDFDMQKTHVKQEIIKTEHNLKKAKISTPAAKKSVFSGTTLDTSTKKISSSGQSSCSSTSSSSFKSPDSEITDHPDHITDFSSLSTEENLFDIDYDLD